MKNLALFIFSFFTLVSVAQADFQGMAVYESKTSTSEMTKRLEGNKNITPEMQKNIEERMKKMFEKTFIMQILTNRLQYIKKRKSLMRQTKEAV
ncbi:MAG: hypothetical protein R2805_02780 [Flavobacterium sp.]|uniref:hypothetical protein n=1 Tax=Flavobacterium sp. TaxID=239 RepID=UPI003527704C